MTAASIAFGLLYLERYITQERNSYSIVLQIVHSEVKNLTFKASYDILVFRITVEFLSEFNNVIL